MMRIVLDTNILLVSVSSKSESHWLFDAFQKKKFELAFPTEILTEYNADYLVTHDSDFNVLKKIGFPLIHVVSLNEFKQILINEKLITS